MNYCFSNKEPIIKQNGKNPEDNLVWSSGSETYNGDLSKQYVNGSYTEVWFNKASLE